MRWQMIPEFALIAGGMWLTLSGLFGDASLPKRIYLSLGGILVGALGLLLLGWLL